ncbi:MAG: hypothetical protein LBD99_02315 [Candidatus Margulisbacteria bacterium]|jgi:hypothetical protein|nr:hypothetical protein [Candidatus Margulisiibacteriota bacterium]
MLKKLINTDISAAQSRQTGGYSKFIQKEIVKVSNLLNEITPRADSKTINRIAQSLLFYYPLFSCLIKNNPELRVTTQQSFFSLHGLLNNDRNAFGKANRIYPAKLDQQNFENISRKITGLRLNFNKNILLTTLLITNNYGIFTDNAAYQYYSMENAMADYVAEFLSVRDIDFASFALRYSSSIQSFINGELSLKILQKKILPQLKIYAQQDARLYYIFILLNLINAHIPPLDYINNQNAAYYTNLFDAEKFLKQGPQLFTSSLPAAQAERLRSGLSSKEFEGLNVFNLYPLINTLKPSLEQADKFINYIARLAKEPKIRGKDIIFFTTDSPEKYLDLQEDLAARLDVYTEADFLDPVNQKFLGYRYYINNEHNYIRIYATP